MRKSAPDQAQPARGDRDVDTTDLRLALVPLELARRVLDLAEEDRSRCETEWDDYDTPARDDLRDLRVALGIDGEPRPHNGGHRGNDTPPEPVV